MIYSLVKNSKTPLEIYVFNGTHNSVEPMNAEPFLAPMSLKAKYTNVTEFSNYRFIIPELCKYAGRAIYVDSDMLALGDINELFNAPMNGHAMLAKRDAYGGSSEPRWGLSVTLFDCEKCRFDLDAYVDEIHRGAYTMTDLHQMTGKFLALHPFSLGEIDPAWNVFDYYDDKTKLIHYTNLLSQPWKFPGHRFEGLWRKYFDEARQAGIVSERDVELSKLRAYARQDITGTVPSRSVLARGKRLAKRLLSR
jgi:lipopolysaccharide biosynthesis glycosyltransferase